MPQFLKFFEDPAEWLSNFETRQLAVEKLIDEQRSERSTLEAKQKQELDELLCAHAAHREKLEQDYAGRLGELTTKFSNRIREGETLLAEVAPVSAKDVAGIPSRRAAYSDRMAALLAKFALLSYIGFEDDERRRVLAQTLACGTVTLIDTIVTNDTEVLVGEAADFVIVAFRGSTSRNDWNTDFSIAPNKVTVEGYARPVRVHAGFYRAFSGVELALAQTLTETGHKPIYYTGHSLGGALALVASAVFGGTNTLGERSAAVYTFGAPRLGDGDFPDIVKAPHYRVVNSGDLVPLVPPTWLSGYKHTGTPLVLKRDANRPSRRRPIGSALLLALESIALWPFAGQLRAMGAHSVGLYASRLQKIAEHRGSWT